MFCESLCEWMNGRDARFFLLHTLKRAWRSQWFQHLPSQWGHKYINYISRTAMRVTSQAFYRFIWVKPASYHSYTHTHGNVKVFTATRQNKSSFLLKRHCARNILLLFSRMYVILLLLLKKLIHLYLKEIITQYFFHILILTVNPLYLPKNKMFLKFH